MNERSSRHAVVVAHPDDEALWLSPAIRGAAKIIFCFGAPFGKPGKAESRRRAVAALTSHYPITDLALPESGAGFDVDWTNARATAAGLEIQTPDARKRYEHNFDLLRPLLATSLEGFSDVYTHNPWGEYGHSEHVQVHRVIATLQAQLGFRLWYSNYVGPRSWPLARRLAASQHWIECRRLAPDLENAHRLRDVYRNHGAWTWTGRHRWPAFETQYLHASPSDVSDRKTFAGEVLLDTSALRRWQLPWRSPYRQLS